jgi:hypothetical protein
MSEPFSEKNLNDLAAGLASLAPAPARIDRDRLLFTAGQASVRRPVWVWPLAAACLALSTAVLTGLLIFQAEPQPIVRYVERIVPAPPLPPDKAPDSSPPSQERRPRLLELVREQRDIPYYRLQDHVLRFGLDGLASAAPAPPPAEKQPNGGGDLFSLRTPTPPQTWSLPTWLFSSTGDN